jgi:hypothetical protein
MIQNNGGMIMSIDISVHVSFDAHVDELNAALNRIWNALFNEDHKLQISIENNTASEANIIGPYDTDMSIGLDENPRVRIRIFDLGDEDVYAGTDPYEGGFIAVMSPYRCRRSFLLMSLVGIAFSEVFQQPIMDDANRISLGLHYDGRKLIDYLRSFHSKSFTDLTDKFCDAVNVRFGTETSGS